jgi:hypothetical protein
MLGEPNDQAQLVEVMPMECAAIWRPWMLKVV